jgi:hypothetical protein
MLPCCLPWRRGPWRGVLQEWKNEEWAFHDPQSRSTSEYSSVFNSYRDMKWGVVLPTNKTDQKLTPPTTVHQLNQLTNHLLVTRFVFPPLAHLN